MKFSGSIEINQPRELVARLFADPAHFKEWQAGFVKKDHVSGTEGQAGAVSTFYYQQGKRDVVLTETVDRNTLPEAFEATYHHKHMDNTMKCYFTELAPNKTRYDYEFEYTRVAWVMPRLMFMLFPGMFRKQGEKWMRQFKEFAEKQ